MSTLFVDLDNTLCECERYYRHAEKALALHIHTRTGLPEATVEALRANIDIEAVRLPGGFQRDRMPRTFRATSLVCDVLSGQPLDTVSADQAAAIGEAVFSAPYELYPAAPRILNAYRQGGWRVVLVTKGDKAVQRWKITKNKLEELTDAQYILPDKAAKHWEHVVNVEQCDVAHSWVVGDSLRDDVEVPALLGLGTALVEGNAHPAWNKDVHATPHLRVRSIAELPDVLPRTPPVKVWRV